MKLGVGAFIHFGFSLFLLLTTFTIGLYFGPTMATVQRSVFNFNTANEGGGILFSTGTGFVSDCTFNNNVVTSFGGGKRSVSLKVLKNNVR